MGYQDQESSRPGLALTALACSAEDNTSRGLDNAQYQTRSDSFKNYWIFLVTSKLLREGSVKDKDKSISGTAAVAECDCVCVHVL